jgi:hypothetical protein
MGTPAPDAVKRLIDRFDQDRKASSPARTELKWNQNKSSNRHATHPGLPTRQPRVSGR